MAIGLKRGWNSLCDDWHLMELMDALLIIIIEWQLLRIFCVHLILNSIQTLHIKPTYTYTVVLRFSWNLFWKRARQIVMEIMIEIDNQYDRSGGWNSVEFQRWRTLIISVSMCWENFLLEIINWNEWVFSEETLRLQGPGELIKKTFITIMCQSWFRAWIINRIIRVWIVLNCSSKQWSSKN